MIDRELDEVICIARLAAARVSEVYAAPFRVEMKGPGDPVTIADRDANEIICRALETAFPGDSILAEESVPDSPDEIARLSSKERVWFVDPLDGTREFADKNGEFAVMIGLAEGGRARLGVVLMPVSGEVFAGRIGGGAFIEDRAGARRPPQVSRVQDPKQATMVTSRSHRPAIVGPVEQRLGIPRVIPCGSVGVKIARIVLGQADLYVHGGAGAKRWDTAAPEAILEAAGGRFTDLAGAPIAYATSDLVQRTGILATNGLLHEQVFGVTRSVGE